MGISGEAHYCSSTASPLLCVVSPGEQSRPAMTLLSEYSAAGAQLPVRSGCFSVAGIRRSVQDNLEREEFILADRSRRIGVSQGRKAYQHVTGRAAGARS